MRNFFIVLSVLLAGMYAKPAAAQSETDFLNLPKMNTDKEFSGNLYKLVGFAFRHHGNGRCICPACVCPGCPCPVGICVCFDFRPVSLMGGQKLSQKQVDAGYGRAWVRIGGGLMHVIFLDPNDENGVLPVDTSPALNDKDASAFGSASPFSITNNDYTVYKNKYTYGEAVLKLNY
jgi:hypothetical protein